MPGNLSAEMPKTGGENTFNSGALDSAQIYQDLNKRIDELKPNSTYPDSMLETLREGFTDALRFIADQPTKISEFATGLSQQQVELLKKIAAAVPENKAPEEPKNSVDNLSDVAA